MELHYLVTVCVPDEIDPDTALEIVADAQDHDDTDTARVARWLGGFVSDARCRLADDLPEGWRVTVHDHYYGSVTS
jgi:hypothetical protein